eukprot:CAMPEP_0206547248 /NCGR_PEP_ID=MMETSP0325_2-20121206/13186_1 /ASSEMBLY_ACC=CAM_ASM_000347 /TAXON_ID=2866 /ORGANISM="Crypthecodinium cohnii, Strain Seligo" /LENGTH=336 /DNA_ID=CAMNT_0054046523 /DNA_START=151 /DNA_END=1157 /DNA_ORIENTATION=+
MALEDLAFQVDQLTYQLDERSAQHSAQMKLIQAEVLQLKSKLREQLQRLSKPRDAPPLDSTFVRKIEWTINDASKTLLTKEKNQALWSGSFYIMGAKMQLEFFPTGRDSTWLPDFCALFLWCPAGVRLTYRLRVGQHSAAPDTDEYQSRMGHGHSNFCHLRSQVDAKTDSVTVGVEILDMSVLEDVSEGLRVANRGPEALVRRKVASLIHRDKNTVEWTIANINKRALEIPKGCSICSPPFSIAGVPEIFLELYPNGVQVGGQEEDPEKAGFCGLYLRCAAGHSLQVTLFVGNAKKGPIKTDFSNDSAKGLPAFCKLSEQITANNEVVVGVIVLNP